MDFHTKKIILSHDIVSNIAGNVLIRYSSANNERTGHLDFNFGRKNWGFLTNVSHSMFNNLRQGANGLKELDRTFYAEKVNGQDLMIKNDNVNMQIQSAYNQVNVLQKFFVKLSDHVDMGYNFQFTTSTDIP